MMLSRRLALTAVVLATSCFAQNAKPAAAPTKASAQTPAAAKAAQKPPVATTSSEVVLRLKGACKDATGKTPDRSLAQPGCHNVVTRAEFERLVKGLYPEANPSVRRSFANNLGRMMMFANEGERRGVDKLPEFQDLVRFARIQVIAQMASQAMIAADSNIPAADVEAYYKANQSQYEEFTLQRVVVPKSVASKDKPVEEAAERAFAEDIRKRWIAGEDGEKLQKEAFQHANNTMTAPPVEIGARRRGTLPMTQTSVFNLKAGEVSEPINDPTAYFLYKVISRDLAPLAKFEEEIRRTLLAQRMQADNERLNKESPLELSDAYFAPAPPPQPAVHPNSEKKPQ